MADAHLRRWCRQLFFRRWSLQQISDETGVNYNTLASWKKRDKWDDAKPLDVVEEAYEARILQYLDQPDIDEGDMKRLDFCMRQIERVARTRKFEVSGKEADLNPKIAARNDDKAKEKRAEKRKNHLTLEQLQALLDDFHATNFEYQELWWAQRKQRTRKLRKTRQCGATRHFSLESICKVAECVLNSEQPRNQIFLSASQRQSNKFRREIVNWVRKVTGIELKGNPIMLDLNYEEESYDAVGFYPLSTNSATAQGESGDFYFDEYAWVHGFAELKKVASGMATHKIYTRTYFSTASTKTHESYAFWSGAEWNKGKAKQNQRLFDISKRNLRNGAMMPDGSWQHFLDIYDACAGGLDALVDINELKQEYSEDEFRNLFECDDIDDSESSFPFSLISACMVDPILSWRDFKPAMVGVPGARPFGDKPVIVSLDPNRGGRDDAAIVVLALPEKPGAKFRLLEKLRFNDEGYEGQARRLQEITKRYNVVDISIDISDAYGKAICELVRTWFPTVRGITYSVVSKGLMVQKAQSVMRARRFEFDAAATDVPRAFIAVHPVLTPSGKQVSYATSRAGDVGHGDIAWAIMMALSIEPLDASSPTSGGGGRVVFSD